MPLVNHVLPLPESAPEELFLIAGPVRISPNDLNTVVDNNGNQLLFVDQETPGYTSGDDQILARIIVRLLNAELMG